MHIVITASKYQLGILFAGLTPGWRKLVFLIKASYGQSLPLELSTFCPGISQQIHIMLDTTILDLLFIFQTFQCVQELDHIT